MWYMLEINLSELQKTLDSQGLEVVENQKESVVGRKALADKTKGMSLTVCSSRCMFTFQDRLQEDTR